MTQIHNKCRSFNNFVQNIHSVSLSFGEGGFGDGPNDAGEKIKKKKKRK